MNLSHLTKFESQHEKNMVVDGNDLMLFFFSLKATTRLKWE
jgi:hypothetical protein